MGIDTVQNKIRLRRKLRLMLVVGMSSGGAYGKSGTTESGRTTDAVGYFWHWNK